MSSMPSSPMVASRAMRPRSTPMPTSALRRLLGQVRLPIAEPTQSLVSLFVRKRQLPDELRTGTCITWADVTDDPSVRVSVVAVTAADTTVSHKRWRATVDGSILPAPFRWLANGNRSGRIRSGVSALEEDNPAP